MPVVVGPVVDGIGTVEGEPVTPVGGTPVVDVGGAPMPLGAKPFAPFVPFSPGTLGPRPAAGLVLDIGGVLEAPLVAAGTVMDIPSDGRYIDVDATPLSGSCTFPPDVPVRPPIVAPAFPVAARFGLAAAPPGPPFGAAPGPVDPLAVAAVGPPP